MSGMLSYPEGIVSCRSSLLTRNSKSADDCVAELMKGDSGSLVLDEQSYEAYGHLVASNPLAELYVIPLAATIRQIKLAFDANDVSFPSASKMLAKQALLPIQSDSSLMSIDLAEEDVQMPEIERLDHWSFESGITRSNDLWNTGNSDPRTTYTVGEFRPNSISSTIHGNDVDYLARWAESEEVQMSRYIPLCSAVQEAEPRPFLEMRTVQPLQGRSAEIL